MAFLLLAFGAGAFGWILAAVFVGLVSGAAIRRVGVGVCLAAGTAAAGFIWGGLTLTVAVAQVRGQGMPLPVFQTVLRTAMNGWFAPSMLTSVFREGLTASSAMAGVMAIGVAALAAYASGAWIASDAKDGARRRIVGWIAVAVPVLALLIVMTGAEATRNFDKPLPKGLYAYDASVYRATYEEMVAGTPYYEAVVLAAGNDRRLAEQGAVKDGKFVAWIESAPQLRMPYAFVLWRASAPSGAAGVMYLGAVLLGVLMLLSHCVLERRVGPVAAFAPVALLFVTLPLLTWDALFFPELWAGLLAVGAVLLWLRGWRVAGVVAAFAAAVFRDVALITVVLFGVSAVVVAWRAQAPMDEPAWRRWAPAIASAVAIGLFAGLYVAHAQASAPIIASAKSGGSTVVKMLAGSAKRDLVAKAIAPSEFGQGPMWFAGLWSAACVLLQLPGWWFGVADKDRVLRYANRLASAGLGAFWVLVLVTIGATSPQWGLLYLPLAFVGTAILPAGAMLLASGAKAEVDPDLAGPDLVLG